MSTTPTCRLTDITASYGRTRAVDGVTLHLHSGITALLGPNGAGKTTLLSLLATLRAPDAGRLDLLGHDPASEAGRLALRRRLGYMPQEPGFHRRFTVFDFVDYVAILKEHTNRVARHAEVARVVDLVGLGDRVDSRIRTLSGGMRRRVALAQALLDEPALLLLDEPTAGMNPQETDEMTRFIKRLRDDLGITILLIEHDMRVVMEICEQISVLDYGIKIAEGTPKEIQSNLRVIEAYLGPGAAKLSERYRREKRHHA